MREKARTSTPDIGEIHMHGASTGAKKKVVASGRELLRMRKS